MVYSLGPGIRPVVCWVISEERLVVQQSGAESRDVV
jgi:hypothetical protein